MIRVKPPDKPPGFDENVRDKGFAWLNDEVWGARRRELEEPRPYWRLWKECPKALAEGFSHRCGYLAAKIHPSSGQVDHFVSWAESQAANEHHLAYTWENFRWAEGRINTIKAKLDKQAKRAIKRGTAETQRLLDPFEVKDEWFELDLVKGVLKLTAAVPTGLVARVEHTLEALELFDGDVTTEYRESALDHFRGGAGLDYIETHNPLVARALRRLFECEESELSERELRLRDELLAAHEQARRNQTNA